MKILTALLVLFTTQLAPAALPSPVTITNADNKDVSLSSSKEKLLVVLWATWCPDCKSKMKSDLPRLQNDEKIAVLALNTEKHKKRVTEFLRDEKIQLPVAYDSKNQFRKTFQLFNVPAWAVFSRAADGTLTLVDKGSPFDNSRINTALGKTVFN